MGQPGRAPRPGGGRADVSLTEEQQDLRDAVRGLLAREEDERSLWRRLCGEVGVAGLAIPERYGGAGAGPAETGVVMEELGRDLTCSPMLGSAVLAAQALLASGDDAACGRLLPAIADGSATAALAWTTRAGHWDSGEVACQAPARPRGGWELDGEAHYVLDGDTADVLLVAARAAGGHRAVRGGPAPGRRVPYGQPGHGRDPAAGDGAADRGARPARRRGRGRRAGPGPGPRVHRAGRRAGGRGPAGPGPDRRLRADQGAVRPGDRRFPGAAAPDGRPARPGGVGAVAGPRGGGRRAARRQRTPATRACGPPRSRSTAPTR